MATQFGNRIKELRSQQNLLQRQVAALLEMDTPLYSKVERGERIAKKELVLRLAELLKADKDEFVALWLADQLFDVVKEEDLAEKAIKITEMALLQKKQNNGNQ